jgi:16S rRNA (guanine966-N2)-methyltransferase
MTGRARESVFSILGVRLEGSRVLDLFAGSGSLGLESLSRGASEAVFVERSNEAVDVIEANIERVGLGGSVIRGSVDDVIGRISGTFDVVFVDPPYADSDAAVRDVISSLDGVLADGGIVIVHRQARSHIAVPEFLTCRDERQYGDAVVTMMERSQT